MRPDHYQEDAKGQGRFYYGWVIVGLAFCSLLFWFGVRTSFSVFYIAMGEEFAWRPGALAGAQSMSLIASMISAPLLGALLDRFGPRKIIIPGTLILTAGLALCSRISSLVEFYLFYGVVAGAAVTAVGVVTYSSVLRPWFVKNRGLANGIAVSGMGAGMLVFVPLTQYVITIWGWREAFLLLSALCGLFLFPATLAFLRPKPTEQIEMAGEIGAQTVDRPDKDRAPAGAVFSDRPLYGTLRTSTFWYFMLFASCSSVGVYIILVHSVKFLVEQGTDAMVASMALALVGVISSVFRILWGWVSDRIGREPAYTIGSINACLGIGFLLMREMSGLACFTYLFAVFFGIGWGVTAPSIMASSADLFDSRQYGFIFGLVQGVINMAGAFGAWLGGAIFGGFHSYYYAFLTALAAMAFSSLFLWKAKPCLKPSVI